MILSVVRQENTIDSVGVYQRCVGMAVASRVLREVDIRDAWNFTETPRNHKAYRRDMRKFDKKWFQSKITRNKLTYIVKKAGGFPGKFFLRDRSVFLLVLLSLENVTIGRSFYAGLFEERVTYAKSWSRNQVIRAKFRKEVCVTKRFYQLVYDTFRPRKIVVTFSASKLPIGLWHLQKSLTNSKKPRKLRRRM